MITIDKRSIFPIKWLEEIQLNRFLPGDHLEKKSGDNPQQKHALHPIKTVFQGIQRRSLRSRGNLTGLFDSGHIEEELRQSGLLSTSCALVGMCEDGLPFILDFTNPAPGSLLVAGDTGSGKRQLIDSLLQSISRFNNPSRFKIQHVSQEAENIQVTSSEDILSDHSLDTETLATLIRSFSAEIELRKKNNLEDHPVQILVVDDLLALVARMDTETLSLFHRIIKHGPRNRLWTIAGLNSCDIPVLEPRILEAFRTHLICGIQDRKLAHELSGNRRLNTRDLEFGSQFFVPYGDQWLRSWICQPSIEQGMEARL